MSYVALLVAVTVSATAWQLKKGAYRSEKPFGKRLITCWLGMIQSARAYICKYNGLESGCNEEFLQVIQLVRDDQILAFKIGQPVGTKFSIPVGFRMI